MKMAAFQLSQLLLFVSLFQISSTSGATANETDRLALLAFKSNIIHDPRGVLSSWNNSFHFCEWTGVTCSRRHRRITVIDLTSTGLVGSLSPHMGNLSFLRLMTLQNNTLQGKIPPEFGRLLRLRRLMLSNNSLEGEIPANLSHCSKLTSLAVANNKLTGKIPTELSFLSNLVFLGIHWNSLTGNIPPFIGNLTSLAILSASGNNLRGSLPNALGQLKNLISLGFGSNELHGVIPPSIYNISSLIELSVGYNQLHGGVSRDLGLMLPRLQVLQLRGNQFTGPLPHSLSNASQLQELDMSVNNFHGKISINFRGLQRIGFIALYKNSLGSGEADEMHFLSSLVNCSNLEVLVLGGNQIRGALPNDVGNLSTQFQILALEENHIYGGIPSTIGNLINLNLLSLCENHLTGTIATSIGYLQKLNRLYLFSNKLSGKIPYSIGNLSFLNVLRLDNNMLRGTIPSSLGNFQSLLLLNISQNNLSGTIPKQLFNVSTLSISLNLARNHLSGSLSLEVGNLKSLSEFDVSGNDLSGEIPNTLGSCSSLEYLYLGGNFFHGSFPSSFRPLRGLRKLDLSHNNLSGQIPKYLETFSLKILNLSFNDFEGEVPINGVFANVSAISVIGNSKLCGGISELQLSKCNMNESKSQRMSMVHKILISIAGTLLGITMVSCYLFCWLKKKRKAVSSGSPLGESFLRVSYEMLLKATDGFSLSNLIDVGSFGSVYKGILDQDETIVAVKVLNLQQRGATKSFFAECEALRNIRHRNLVKIITSCSSVDFQGDDFKALVYEFMPNGNLDRWLHSRPETDNGQDEVQSLDLLQRVNIAIDVASAIDYLHHHCETPIIHCDLKPSNILLDSEMTAHVGDFGLAKFFSEFCNPNQSSSIGIRGTTGYAAPEYGLGSQVSTHGDVYSYGIVLLEMMTGKRPTDPMFLEGLNLHNFATMGLPNRVMEIVDPNLLRNIDEEAAAAAANNNRHLRQERNRNIKECLICLFKIGVACSMESPSDRMDIENAVRELHSVQNILQRTQTNPNARGPRV